MRKRFPFKPRKEAAWLLPILASLCSCATEQYLRWVSPDDLVCNRDDDCQIVQGDVVSCPDDDDDQPYAISRTALSGHQGESRRRRERCTVNLSQKLCTYDPSEWKAVCSDHLCERRSARWFSEPKPHCPDLSRQ